MFSKLGWLFFSCVLCLGCVGAWAESTDVLAQSSQAGNSGRVINSEVGVLRDPSGQLTIDEIANSLNDRFSIPGILRFGQTRDVVWLRIPMRRPPKVTDDWVLEVSPASLDDLQLFAPNTQGHYTLQFQVGDRHSFSKRPVAYRHFILPLPLPDTQIRVYYLRIQTTSALNPVLRLWLGDDLRDAGQIELLLFGLLFGALLSAILATTIGGLWFRSRVYFSYSGLITLLLAQLLTRFGLLAQLVFPNYPEIPNRMLGINLCVFLACMLLLIRKHLNTKHLFAKMDRWIPKIALAIGLLGLGFLGDSIYWVAPIARSLVVIIAALTIYAAWVEFHSPRPKSIIIIIGNIVFSTAFIIASLCSNNLSPWPELADVWWSIGSALLAFNLSVVWLKEMVIVREANIYASAELGRYQALHDQKEKLMQDQVAYFSYVVHELGTPLNVAVTGLENLRWDVGMENAETKSRINRITKAVQRVSTLISRHLRLQGMMSGNFQPAFDQISPKSIVKNAIEIMGEAYPERLVHFSIDADLPSFITQDEELITLALVNLLGNAIKFSPADSTVYLEVGLDSSHPKSVSYRVRDSGVGIGEEDQERLFQIFAQATGYHKIGFGFGIGLALVANVARLHRGSVECASTIGLGSTFHMRVASVRPQITEIA